MVHMGVHTHTQLGSSGPEAAVLCPLDSFPFPPSFCFLPVFPGSVAPPSVMAGCRARFSPELVEGNEREVVVRWGTGNGSSPPHHEFLK